MFVANFIGDSNILPCTVTGSKKSEKTVKIGTMNIKKKYITSANGVASALIRPEHIRLHRSKKASSLTGTINKATYVGSKIEYSVLTEIGVVFVVDLSDSVEFTVGQQVYIQLPVEKLNIYGT